MKLLPIRLSVKRGAFRSDFPSPPGSDAVYRSAREQVLKRDDYTCRFCGFRSSKTKPTMPTITTMIIRRRT